VGNVWATEFVDILIQCAPANRGICVPRIDFGPYHVKTGRVRVHLRHFKVYYYANFSDDALGPDDDPTAIIFKTDDNFGCLLSADVDNQGEVRAFRKAATMYVIFFTNCIGIVAQTAQTFPTYQKMSSFLQSDPVL
jgi:hypothetical protein